MTSPGSERILSGTLPRWMPGFGMYSCRRSTGRSHQATDSEATTAIREYRATPRATADLQVGPPEPFTAGGMLELRRYEGKLSADGFNSDFDSLHRTI